MADRVVARPWTVVASKITYADRWIRLRTDDVLNARGDIIADFHVLEYPDWINVIVLQEDGHLMLAREYRHGVEEIVLGLISGSVDPSDGALRRDGPAKAARRELLEETGYTAQSMAPVLTCFVNPASHNSRVTTFIARGLEKAAEPRFEVGEEVELVRMKPKDLFLEIGKGAVTMQAMHLAGLYAAVHANLIVL